MENAGFSHFRLSYIYVSIHCERSKHDEGINEPFYKEECTHRHRCVPPAYLGVSRPLWTHFCSKLCSPNPRNCVHPTQKCVVSPEHRVCVEFSAWQHIWCVQWSRHTTMSVAGGHISVSAVFTFDFLKNNRQKHTTFLGQQTKNLDSLRYFPRKKYTLFSMHCMCTVYSSSWVIHHW